MIKILVIAVVSFLLGFVLVILFFRQTPTSGSDEPDDRAGVPPPPATERPAPSEPGGGGYAPPDPTPGASDDRGDEIAAEEGEGRHEGEAPPEVPPGRTPEGVALDGNAFYLKCWDTEGNELPGASCDRLKILEKRFSTRLYVVDRCRSRHAKDAEGKLSLGLEVDFDKMALSYWNGASSDLPGAAKVATCLRDELAGLPIGGVDHKRNRYRMFFTVLFGKAAASKSTKPKGPPPKGGKLVDVVKDRVRVREAPKDGAVIGKISTGNQVRLLGKKAGWCHVVTPNDNEGWMICDALGK